MPTQPLSDEVLREAWQAVRDSGSVSGAAKASGIPRNTLDSRLEQAMRRLDLPHPTTTVVSPTPFSARSPPSKERPLDELLRHRRAEAGRAVEYESGTQLIRIDINTPGPIGLFIMGDPHLDNPGCDFNLLESHLQIAAKRREYVFAGNIGDIQDNWIGRLERLYADTTVSSKEIWTLVEWMFSLCGVKWTWLCRGNHDKWSGRGDPLDWIAKSAGVGVDQNDGMRLAFHHPNGAITRMHARHDFSGHSQFNPLHALKKEVLHGFRDHIIVAGHRHIGADARDVNGEGMPFVMCRVSGYKVSDSYRHTLGLKAKPLHPAALIIVDPDEPDTSNTRVWCAPTVEEGSAYLDFKRKRYESKPPSKRAPPGGNKHV